MNRARAAILLAILVATSTAGRPDERPGDAVLNADRRFIAINARPENGSGSETGTYLPPIAGAQSEITGTVVADSGAGVTDFYVGAVDGSGASHYWKGTTDAQGRFHLRIPQFANGVASLVLFKHFDAQGKPDAGATTRITSATAHLENTVPLANVPASGPAIVESRTSYELGGQGKSLVPLHVRDVNPLSARVLVDGSSRGVDTLASSDLSVVGKLHDDIALGRHSLAVQSDGRASNTRAMDVVTLRFDPIGELRTGQQATVRVHVDGLGRDPADITFTVSGAASLADGSPSERVPVREGIATTEIRGEHPGALVLRTLLDVAIAQGVAESVPTAEPVESKPPTATPKPLYTGGGLKIVVTPPPPTPTPTEAPVIVERKSGGLVPCSFKVVDGYMQPTQGFWQDDKVFSFPDILIRLGLPGDEPSYKAPYPLVVNRPTVVGGVDSYRWLRSGQVVTPHDRDTPRGNVRMVVMSNCPLPDFVRFHFAFAEQNAGTVWRADTGGLGAVNLHGMVPPGTQPHAYPVDLPVPLGYPDRTAFEATSPGYYTLFCQLEKFDPQTGRWIGPLGEMTVNVQVLRTQGPLVRFIPVVLFKPATGSVDAAGKKLEHAALKEAQDTSHLLPDLYPLEPGKDMQHSSIPSVQEPYRDFTSIDAIAHPLNHLHLPADVVHDFPDLVDLAGRAEAPEIQQTAINTELARIFNLTAILSHAGRIVVVLDQNDITTLDGPDTVAYTLDTKVVFVPDNAAYTTIGHELAHTLPWDYTHKLSPQDIAWMLDECHKGYHNQKGDFAQGLRFIQNGGQVNLRTSEQGANHGMMGPYNPHFPNPYIEQCTSRHLTQKLRGIPDPPVIVVRGVLVTNGTKIDGFFDPFYRASSEVDAEADDPQFHLHLVLKDARGSVLKTVPVQPKIYGPDDRSIRRLSAFMVRVPIIAGLQSIELRAGDRLLAQRRATAFAPVVNIVGPRSGAVMHESIPATLAWSTRASKSASLSATILDSTDGGKTFQVLAVDQPGTTYRLSLRGRGTHLVRVIVSDGWQNGQADATILAR